MKEGEMRVRIWAVHPEGGGSRQMFYPRDPKDLNYSGMAITAHGHVVWLYDAMYDNIEQNWWTEMPEPELMEKWHGFAEED